MLNKLFTIIMLLCVGLLLGETVLFFEGFEGETFPPSSEWLIYNATLSGVDWIPMTAADEVIAHSGNGVAGSQSYCEGACVYPDNWLITPRITIAAEATRVILELYLGAKMPDNYLELFHVLISTNENQNLIAEYPIEQEFTLTTPDWTKLEMDLSLYAGESIYIAFRHLYNDDEHPSNVLLLDDIKLYAEGVESDTDITLAPQQDQLKGNYPNPFNPTTTISFYNATPGNVQIDVFNLKGQKVRSLVNAFYDKGEHYAHWDGTDGSGHEVSSGIYLYQMKKDDYSSTKRMILMK